MFSSRSLPHSLLNHPPLNFPSLVHHPLLGFFKNPSVCFGHLTLVRFSITHSLGPTFERSFKTTAKHLSVRRIHWVAAIPCQFLKSLSPELFLQTRLDFRWIARTSSLSAASLSSFWPAIRPAHHEFPFSGRRLVSKLTLLRTEETFKT